MMTRQEILDLYFLDARSKLIDLGAFLDRLARAEGESDFRLDAFCEALRKLSAEDQENAQRVLMTFSDPTTEPIAAAPGKSACGAFPPSTVP